MARLLLISGLALASGLAGLAGCGGNDRPSPDRPPTRVDPPQPFPAASADVPAGFREVLCPDLRRDGTGLTVRLVVPVATTGGQQSEDGCSFSHGSVRSVGVQIGPERTLAAFRAQELDPFEDIGGDDEVSDITYRGDAPGLDGKAAEELTWRVYNDGLPYWEAAIQVAGVRLSWTVPDDKPRRLDSFDVVRRSVAVLHGTGSLCPSWGAADRPSLTFSPPKEAGWVERDGDRCRIYREEAPTLLEYGAVDPTPGDLDTLAAQVRRDPEVVRVRLRRDAGRIDGEPADLLTWVVVRTEETESYEPPGTWRIVALQSASARVEWGATPQWWHDDRSTYDDLVASVRISPARPSPP